MNHPAIVRIVVAAVLAALAVLLGVLQYGGAIAARRETRNYSWVPFIGALLGVSACLVAPFEHSAYAIPVFLVLDPSPITFAALVVTGRFLK